MVAESMKITGGLVVDGTGAAARRLDLLIEGDTITAIGESLPGHEMLIIDAKGLIISPGFIDIHSHSDLSILANEYSPEKLLQGVTTEVVGNCGLGLAPSNKDFITILNQVAVDLMNGALMRPIPTMQAFFDNLHDMGHSVNIAALIPQGNVRALVMGTDEAHASRDQLSEMTAMIDRDMATGAFGISTGLIYPPGSITGTSELVELAKALKPHDGFYASHIRNESGGVIKAVKEAMHIGREAGIPVQISHLKVAFNNRLTSKLLKTISDAREAGLDVLADAYPYTAGASNLGAIVLPTWVFGTNITATLMDPVSRKRVVDEAIDTMFKFAKVPSGLKPLIPKPLVAALLKFLGNKVLISNTKRSPHLHGKTLNEALDEDPEFHDEKGMFNKTLHLLAREEGNVTICIFQENEQKTLLPILKSPHVMIGSDSLAGHPRTWGTYPRVLGKYVRDGGILSLPEAIHKMTGMPAGRLGLQDRGLIKERYKADIVVFDPATVNDNGTFSAWNTPPTGILHVLVNGKLVVEDGKHLHVKSGTTLKHQEAGR